MLYFEKSQPEPECLPIEKGKAVGDYKCGCVLDRLKADFKNKCYICEWSAPAAINVEHFRPHRGDKDLKFSWENLFWSCAHCNNAKSDDYNDILDCTRLEDNIESRIKYEFKPFPKEMAKLSALDDGASTLSTRNLLDAVFNGTTKLKTIESANIRTALLLEIRDFQELLIEYFQETCEGEDKERCLRGIRRHLHRASNFVSFKRWVVRDNEALLMEFGRYLI